MGEKDMTLGEGMSSDMGTGASVRLQLDPSQSDLVAQSTGEIIFSNFPELTKDIDNLEPNQRIITSYEKRFVGPSITAERKDDTKDILLTIRHGNRYLSIQLSQEKFTLIEHNYTNGYDPRTIIDKVRGSITQLVGLKNNGTIIFKTVDASI